jgi:hypothetical protein
MCRSLALKFTTSKPLQNNLKSKVVTTSLAANVFAVASYSPKDRRWTFLMMPNKMVVVANYCPKPSMRLRLFREFRKDSFSVMRIFLTLKYLTKSYSRANAPLSKICTQIIAQGHLTTSHRLRLSATFHQWTRA